ncbi:MAG: DUF302 domain-containing protein [Gammaproteobacteria bacterium]|nr:DUF302 domain-containing protein [Gammaproteobacteria bacterium]MCW8911067.1 DUF302 domain-containing protein [Gammaproteobacteria bacterium]MCW9004742.1 DUF302 domain-containing protein [Gammaproteobacteria bacterium]MCW9056129.1 DUF302 domain-containing protein [Gammaproteobacteria bacterium]
MYGFNVTLQTTMEDAEAKVRDALMEEGFGVLTEIDVQKVMKAKLDIDRSGYKILGACNPNLAHQAIDAEPDIGLLLPCNVLLREEDNGDINIGFMDPAAVLTLVDNPTIAEVAPVVREKLQRVASKLTA